MKLRVGLVGIGQGWDSHYRGALRALADRFEVRAVCSDVALRAEQIAGEFQARSVDGYRALAAREDVDAVLLLAPDWYGPLPVYAACDFGKALFCRHIRLKITNHAATVTGSRLQILLGQRWLRK